MQKDAGFKDPTDLASPPARLALRLGEAAAALGVCERTLWGWTQEPGRGVPHFYEGRILLFPVEGLRRWVEDRAERQLARTAGADGNEEEAA